MPIKCPKVEDAIGWRALPKLCPLVLVLTKTNNINKFETKYELNYVKDNYCDRTEVVRIHTINDFLSMFKM